MSYRKIVKLRIKNFQSHDETLLELDQRVNVIVGPSDVGKSAIIRALRWLFFNEPRGDAFIRRGEDIVLVEAIYDDGYIIRRIREAKAGGVNAYEIEKDGNIERFQGFGVEPPEEIKEITGVRKYKLSDSDQVIVNFQNQHDSAFMLNDSPAQKAKAIGYLSNVNVIDEAIRRANNKDQNAKNDVKKLESRKEILNNQLKEYEGLDEELKIYELVKNKRDDIIIKRNRLDMLSSLYSSYLANKESIAKGNNYIKQFRNLDQILKIYKDADEKWKQKKSLEKIKKDLVLVKNGINSDRFVLERTENLNELKTKISNIQLINSKRDGYILLIKKYNEINAKINEVKYRISSIDIISIKEKQDRIMCNSNLLNSMKNFRDRLFQINTIYKNEKENLKKIEKEIDSNLARYIELIQKGETCPLCGSKIDESHLKNIKEEYYGLR